MIEQILQWDYTLFHLINQQWANPVFDYLMPLFRNKFFWAPLYAFLISFFAINFKMKGLAVFIFIVVLILITDQLSAGIIKPYVGRLRPCNDINLADQINLLVHCGGGKSFPSAHAANHFGLSFFLIVLLGDRFRWLVPLAILWAFLVAYAQVYVGVHFPLDVSFGGLIGIFFGTWIGYVAKSMLRFREA